jgi:hypothetical protein
MAMGEENEQLREGLLREEIDEKFVSQPSPGEEQKARQHLPFASNVCSVNGTTYNTFFV